MKSFNRFLFFALIFQVISSCAPVEDIGSGASVEIAMNKPSPKYSLSNLLIMDGFAFLKPDQQHPIRGVTKVLFANDRIVLLDRETDFQNIYVFDQETGNFINSIGRQSELDNDAYEGLMDICLDENKNICGLVAGKQSFMTYDLQGNFLNSMSNGIFGSKVVASPGKLSQIVYNELGANEISEDYYLLFYDEQGNLVRRLMPYPEEYDGQSYEFSGFLTALKSDIWFSPPFCDTIYNVTNSNIIPRYVLNFGRPPIPVAVAGDKARWDFESSSFLCEKFACLGNAIVFETTENYKINLNLYDENKGALYKFCEAEKDYLYNLVQAGDIYQKDEHSFALVIRPSRARYMLNNNLLDEQALQEKYPALLSALKDEENKGNYLVLYISRASSL